MRCPHCQSEEGSFVVDTTHDTRGGIRRRRECKACAERYSSYERPILATPMIIKEDGTREEFDREKLMRGLRLACVKRPVAVTDLDRLTGEIEAHLQKMGKNEVPSRVIGDRIIEGLKELDEIAYIRFALVYLGLDDLNAVRRELDRLIDSN